MSIRLTLQKKGASIERKQRQQWLWTGNWDGKAAAVGFGDFFISGSDIDAGGIQWDRETLLPSLVRAELIVRIFTILVS